MVNQEHKDNKDKKGDKDNTFTSFDFEELSNSIQKTINDVKEETVKQAGNVKEEALKQLNRFRNQEDGRAYIDMGHGRRVLSGKLKKNPGLYSGLAEIAVGAAGLGIFGGAGIGFGMTTLFGVMAAGIAATSAVIMIPFAVLSAVVLGKGIFNSGRARRIKQYSQLWMGKQYMMIDDLESRVKWNRKRIMKDIHFLTQRDLIIGAKLDEEETCLLLTDEAKQQYESAMNARRSREQEEVRKRELEESMQNASGVQKEIYRIKKEGQEYLRELSDIKVQICSSVIKEKLDRMEVLSARIFVCASEHPESISQTDRLFKYYFPSVMKLLTVYKDLEKQPIQGENIQKAQGEIEESLDTINQALEKLFDEMFQNVAMDISSDIQVLEVMLKQDGLTEGGMHAEQTNLY